jgi:putative ABC transport system ATP-binding protein
VHRGERPRAAAAAGRRAGDGVPVMGDPMVIEVRGLIRRYGTGENTFLALRGIDLDVARGEILFITGPSGSGKTTLLSILGCVLAPSEGSAKVLGTEVGGLSEREAAAFRLRQLGFVFQGHNLIASLTALENVRLPLMLAGVPAPEAEARALAELTAVGIADRADRLPRDLSGGQRQRVAIARALAGNPPVLLADEPTASLDAQSGRDVMERMTRLARERGTTVVVVTHDNRIFPYADRIVSIEDGMLRKEAA